MKPFAWLLLAGVASGGVTGAAWSRLDYTSRSDRQLEAEYGTRQETTTATGSGSSSTNDSWSLDLAGGEVVGGTRTTEYRQNTDDRAKSTSDGILVGSQGRGGSWTGKSGSRTRVNDAVSVRTTWQADGWQPVEQRFDLDRTHVQSGEYHQWDDGIGREPAPAGVTASDTHTIDSRWGSSQTIQRDGTAEAYSFVEYRSEGYKRREVSSGNWQDSSSGSGGRYQEERNQEWGQREDREGRFVGGAVRETRIDDRRIEKQSTVGESDSTTEGGRMESRRRLVQERTQTRFGDWQSGTGKDVQVTSLAYSWKRVEAASGGGLSAGRIGGLWIPLSFMGETCSPEDSYGPKKLPVRRGWYRLGASVARRRRQVCRGDAPRGGALSRSAAPLYLAELGTGEQRTARRGAALPARGRPGRRRLAGLAAQAAPQ